MLFNLFHRDADLAKRVRRNARALAFLKNCLERFVLALLISSLLVQASVFMINPRPVHALSPPAQFFDFAPIVQPIGVAYSSVLGKLIVDPYNGPGGTLNGPGLFQVDSSGNLAEFALNFNHTDESYLAVSPGLGGFVNGTVFAGTGPNPTIAKISPDGGSIVQAWTTCSGASAYGVGGGAFRGGFTFDQVGSFSNNLLALSSNGILFRVDSSGNCSTVASLSGHVSGSCCSLTEGLTVAPLSFGPLGGDAIIGSNGQLTAVSATGTVSTLLGLSGDIENVNFVPSTPESFFVGMLIGNNASDRVRMITASQFSPTDVGTLITSQEYPFAGSNQANLYQVLFNATTSSYSGKTIASGLTDMEGATFAPFLLPPQFSIGDSGDINVSPGGSGSNIITVSLGAGPSQSVTLACSSGLPSGSSCSFNPVSGSPAYYSTLTVSASSSTPIGSYTITLTGTSAAESHTTQFTLAVVPFDFSMSSSGGISLSPGGSGSNIISATLIRGASVSVILSCSNGLPSGASCSFNPALGTPTFTSTLTISALSSTPTGSNTIIVNGTGGGQTRTTQFTLAVVPFDFSISSSSGISVAQGGSGSNSITVSLLSGSFPVMLSVSGLPSGGLPSFSGGCTGSPGCTASPTFSSVLTVSTSSSTPLGSYSVNVTGTGGGQTHTTQFTLTIAINFSMASSGSITVAQGGSGSNTITATLVGGTSQSVILSCTSGLPTGASCSFNPASGLPSFSSTLTVSASSSTPVGSYAIIVTGAGGGQTRTTQVTFAVQTPGATDFLMLFNSGGVGVLQGYSGSWTFSVTGIGGWSQPVTLLCAQGLPSGAQCMFSPMTGVPTFSPQITISTSGTTPLGYYTITVSVSGGGRTHTTQVTLNVNPNSYNSPRGPLGGVEAPIDKLVLLTPYILLAALIVLWVVRVPRREKRAKL